MRRGSIVWQRRLNQKPSKREVKHLVLEGVIDALAKGDNEAEAEEGALSNEQPSMRTSSLKAVYNATIVRDMTT